MATIFKELLPEEATFLSTAFPQYQKIGGSAYPVSGLWFDPATDEGAFWKFRAVSYGSGNLTLDIDWYADTATTGDVVWGAAIAAITPDTDTQDIETDGLATENTVTDSHLGTVGQRLHRAVITISNLDAIAVNDYITLRIRRVGTNAADTMTGDAIMALATVSYSDT